MYGKLYISEDKYQKLSAEYQMAQTIILKYYKIDYRKLLNTA